MAVTQVGSATTGSDASSGGPFSVSKPTGVQQGDLLVFCGASNEGTWDTFPSGWTQLVVSTDATTPNNFRAYAWYKFAGGSEPASYSFGSTTAGGSGAPMAGVMTAWRNVHNVTPFPHTSTDHLGALAAGSGNPATSFTQSAVGRLFFVRWSRSTVGTLDFTTTSTDWSILGEISAFSGGSVRYGVGWNGQANDTGSGARVEPTMSSGSDTTDNFYLLGVIGAAPQGPLDGATLAPVTSSFAATREIPSGPISATLAPVSFSGVGLGQPPSGTLNTSLAPVTSSFEAASIGGSMASSLAPVVANVSGDVNPIGSWASTLAPVSASFVAETKPFGEHVIVVEPDHRAFRVIDEDPGLIPIKRSEVTDA